MQGSEEVHAVAVAGVILYCRGNEWPRRKRSRLAAEAVSQQLVNSYRGISTCRSHRTEPRWRPLRGLHDPGQPLHLGQHRRDLLLRQLLDKATEFVTGRSHTSHGTDRNVDDRVIRSAAAPGPPADPSRGRRRRLPPSRVGEAESDIARCSFRQGRGEHAGASVVIVVHFGRSGWRAVASRMPTALGARGRRVRLSIRHRRDVIPVGREPVA